MKTVLFVIFILISAGSAFASTCLERPPDIVRFYQSEAIFAGKVLSVKRFYGVKRTQENWNLKYRTVEFEVQKSYKGVVAGSKISVLNSYGDMDWTDLKLKKGQQWLIYAWKKDGNLFFGTGCVPWSVLIENPSEIAELDQDFASLKTQIERDNQAISGRIQKWSPTQYLENIEVNISGNDRQFSVFTDKEGLFFLPVESPGEYKISVKFPRQFLLVYDTVKVPDEFINDAVNNNTLIYKINLKPGEFNFNQLNIGFY